MLPVGVAVLLLKAWTTNADDAADTACVGSGDSGGVFGDCCFQKRTYRMDPWSFSTVCDSFCTTHSGTSGLRDSDGISPTLPAGWRRATCSSDDWAIIQACDIGSNPGSNAWETSAYDDADNSVLGTICCNGGDCCEQATTTRTCRDDDATVGCIEAEEEGGACVTGVAGDNAAASRSFFIGYKVGAGTAQPAQEAANYQDFVCHSMTTFDQGVVNGCYEHQLVFIREGATASSPVPAPDGGGGDDDDDDDDDDDLTAAVEGTFTLADCNADHLEEDEAAAAAVLRNAIASVCR